MLKKLSILLSVCLIEMAHAKAWQVFNIPGAKCGDGSEYQVYYRKGDTQKVLVEFMGGGVCWDYKSCFKKVSFFPWLHQYPILKSYSVFTADKSKNNQFRDFSKLYFPYCTADVHAGSHISQYNGRTVYHYGRKNIELALNYIKENHLIETDSVNDLVVYGASAGAIATLTHAHEVNALFDKAIKKTMIADSPGLHFGKTFWNKFDDSMKEDFKITFNAVNLDVDFTDGVVAKKMGPVFQYFSDWKIGMIHGLKDEVMSKAFGELSPEAQKKIILSEDGVPAVAKSYPNVKVWIKDTYMHTFLLSKYSAEMESASGETVFDFVKTVYAPDEYVSLRNQD